MKLEISVLAMRLLELLSSADSNCEGTSEW
jgi:hypothetical protein